MSTNRGFIAVRDKANHTHVERTGLLGEIDEELARSGVVVVRAPWGYGKSELLRDYARIAHVRQPQRPIARIDLDTFESKSFVAGDRAPLDSLFARRGRKASAREAKTPKKSAGEGRRRARGLPERVSNSVTQCVYAHMRAASPAWCDAYEKGVPLEEHDFTELPLVTVDNLPPMDAKTMGEFAEALSDWGKAGARLLVACRPCTVMARHLLPAAYSVDAGMLAVAEEEMNLWAKYLSLPQDGEVYRATRGVPLLIAATRGVSKGEARFNDAFLRASDRVVAECLSEPMCASAERMRWAMVMLGSGTFDDLYVVGALPREDEMAIVAQSYPFFGIDQSRGSFSCIPVRTDCEAMALGLAVGGDEMLAERCVGLLVERGRRVRATAVASFASGGVRLRLLGRHPDAFADVANDGLVGRGTKAFLVGDAAEGSIHAGLARLVRLCAVAHDTSARLLPEGVLAASVGPATGALRAVRSVTGFWNAYCGGDRVPAAPGDAGAVEATVSAMGAAALAGDPVGYERLLKELDSAVDFSGGGLASSVYASHAAVCGLLCDRAETVLPWLEPLARSSADPDSPPGCVSTVSEGLLKGLLAAARFLVEKPSSSKSAAESFGAIRRSKRFFEERGIRPCATLMGFLEAMCLILSGNELRAPSLLERCQSRWGVQGSMAGQMLVSLALCATDFAQDATNQAAVHAHTALMMAQRLGARHVARVAQLMGSLSAVRSGNLHEVDRRLLKATMDASALYPGQSGVLQVELALLSAASGDKERARDAADAVGASGRLWGLRLAIVSVRALGKCRLGVLELFPRTMRAEYDSVRPSALSRVAMESGGGPRAAVPGLLSPAGCGQELAISLFGGFRVRLNGFGMGAHEWRRKKSRQVLEVLALFPDEAVPRDDVARCLWPGEAVTASMRNNLNTILSNLRLMLGQKGGSPKYFITQGDTLSLNLEVVDVDVLRFERLARTLLDRRDSATPGEVIEACNVLEQIFQSGLGSEFEESTQKVRARVDELASLFVDCMVLGSRVACDRDDYQLASWLIRAAERVDCRRDDVHRQVDAVFAGADRIAEERAQAGAQAGGDVSGGEEQAGGGDGRSPRGLPAAAATSAEGSGGPGPGDPAPALEAEVGSAAKAGGPGRSGRSGRAGRPAGGAARRRG